MIWKQFMRADQIDRRLTIKGFKKINASNKSVRNFKMWHRAFLHLQSKQTKRQKPLINDLICRKLSNADSFVEECYWDIIGYYEAENNDRFIDDEQYVRAN